MIKLYLTFIVLGPALTFVSSWNSLDRYQKETYVELRGTLIVVENYISGTEAYLCKLSVKIKKGMTNCIDLVSEATSLQQLKSTECVTVSGTFRLYSSEFVFTGSSAEVGLLKLRSSNSIKEC